MKGKLFGKKQLVLGVMVLLLGAAVYLNYYVATNTPLTTGGEATGSEDTSATTRPLGESQFVSNTTSTTPETYFDAARRTRDEARMEALTILEETLDDVKTDSAAQQDAVAAVSASAQAVTQEDAIESLIKAKGFEDCVVYIENGNCHVAVKAQTLDDMQTVQILQIVTAQSDVAAENISIVAVE